MTNDKGAEYERPEVKIFNKFLAKYSLDKRVAMAAFDAITQAYGHGYTAGYKKAIAEVVPVLEEIKMSTRFDAAEGPELRAQVANANWQASALLAKLKAEGEKT